jgi:long-chain acyl-CoA synthetase
MGLAALGVTRGDRVAILSGSRFEWAALDFATMSLGAITVPIYQSHRADELERILVHAEPKVLIVEDEVQLAKWTQIARRCPSVEAVVCLESGPGLDDDTLDGDDLLNCGLEMFGNKPDHLVGAIAATRLDDVATIVYTSGTAGEPKGVVLTHAQIMSEVEDLMRAFPISAADSTLSFLPYAHVLGRIEPWLHVYVGFTLFFAEGIERLRYNLVETKPTVIIGVPRIFEKIHETLMSRINAEPLGRRAFNWLSRPGSSTRHLVADRLIYQRLRAALGGRLRFVVSGGAPLDARLAHFFNEAGILILEGYGLTETTGAITANTPGAFEFGTVGRPLGDVEIKIADDGEILIKSEKVFREYHRDDAATAAARVDGYFATGDVGELTEAGFLRLTDRKKDLIKTAGGKYVAPQKLEGLLKVEPLISNVLIYGDRRKFIVALITLHEGRLLDLARDHGWSFRDYRALTQLPEVTARVDAAVKAVNADLANFETIKTFAILPHDFSIERGELTPSLKVKRRVLNQTYRDLINELYEAANPSRSGPVLPS